MNCQRPASAYLPAAIAALSLSLPGSHISPETFRQAKFDQPQCNSPLKCLQDRKSLVSKANIKDQKDVQYLQWLNGCLKLQWRSYHSDQEEQCKLLHKVHFYTLGSHTDSVIGHFSVMEVNVGRQAERYKQLLHFLESDCSRIEAFLKWKPMESLYWHWMETVLDMVIEDNQNQTMSYKGCLLPSSDLGCHGVSRIMEELDKCKKNLLSLHQELSEHITLRKLACYRKVRTRQEKKGEEDFCIAVRKVQAIVELKFSGLMCSNSTSRSNKLHGPYRLIYKKKRLRDSKMDTIETAAPTKTISEGITASDVISFLKKQEARLKSQLKQQQEGDRQKIHKASKKLSQVLFIPPMKPQKVRINTEVGKAHRI
ncbi:tubulin epsilon and delta complex protein 1 isoform X4 [Erythrolamprus reginae]|uniref:tubulin epsilon and delta complex protein 1 isoform X4 n=1 Tax=Erythrolamprus reginae TaxID=121349 RepID=UPI00396C5F13